jgi:glycerol-3-phosphate acyltransferase PlsY
MIRLVCVLIGYCFGLFQTAYIIGKIHGIDIREYGSGNSGTTNMLRTLGKKAGLLTFAGDCLKCMAAIWLIRIIFGKSYANILPLLSVYTGAGVILGHNFPFYLNFRGGKGIASTAGMVLTMNLPLIILGIIAFFGTTLVTHYVSLGSIMVYVMLLIAVPVLGEQGAYGMAQPHRIEMYIVIAALALMAFWRHRANIVRLLHGNERKTYLFKKQ